MEKPRKWSQLEDNLPCEAISDEFYDADEMDDFLDFKEEEKREWARAMAEIMGSSWLELRAKYPETANAFAEYLKEFYVAQGVKERILRYDAEDWANINWENIAETSWVTGTEPLIIPRNEMNRHDKSNFFKRELLRLAEAKYKEARNK